MTRFVDPWLRWLPLLAALLLLALTAAAANSQGVALPVDAACLIQCSDGSAGTGVLVDSTTATDGAHGLILTNHHVCRDAIAQGGTYSATFPGLRKHGARLVAYNAELDLAALEIGNPPVEPAPWTDAMEGEIFYTAGFAGNVDGLRVTCGHVVAERESGRQVSIVIDAGSRAGDSGGPVFDDQGRLCGIRWGTSGQRGATGGPDTYLVDPGQVAAFLRELGVEHVTPQQWPGTVCSPCQPGGSCSPFGGACSPIGGCQPFASPSSGGNVCQQNPDGTWSCPGAATRPALLPGTRIVSPRRPRAAAPSTPSAPSAPSSAASAAPASCDCTDQLAAIEKRLTDLEQRKPEPGPAGPTGPVGPAGPAGKDGSAAQVDEEAIASRVAAIVLAQQPTAQGVSHYVLVADDSASYWPRLAGEYRRASEAYSHIRLSGVPDVPVGMLPQLVAYRDGKPLGSFKGARDVSDALARIARNEPPKP